MKTLHTPGPWSVYIEHAGEGDERELREVSIDSDFGQVAEVIIENCEENDEQIIADGCIIAAAPELLAACQAAFDQLANDPRWNVSTLRLDIIRAAIAKATGETA